MDFITGSSKKSWQPEMTGDTTISAYWLNWRVALCAIWLASCMLVASVIIWKYESFNKSKPNGDETAAQESKGVLYEDEAWKPCLKEIHPAWLLAYRVTAFVLLLALLIVNVIVDTGGIFYYYTQWTFTLVTIYFGLGSILSSYGCCQSRNRVGGDQMASDAEQGIHVAPRQEGNSNEPNIDKTSVPQEQHLVRQTAGIWGYIFQVIFQAWRFCIGFTSILYAMKMYDKAFLVPQMNAGAVMLTDFVFWFIIVPYLAIRDYNLNLLLVGMHSVNAVFLLGDTALNCLRFPWFRISYFLLWTSVFVIFQWIIHACIEIWWPYPFLDLSSSYAPVWYMLVGLMHIPCFAIFALIVKMKHYLWSRWFPHSYQCRR